MKVEKLHEQTIIPRTEIDWALFSLLVVVNIFVGGMVGLERTILPLIAIEDFGIASKAAAISFIITFGVTKAVINFFAGSLSDHWGRRRVLLLGWLIGLPVPLIIMSAQSWSAILFANILLGANQALTWSMTVVMKVDMAQPRQRGLVIGFNEFAGYAGVAAIAYVTGVIASQYGLRPQPFYLGFALALAGLILSYFTKDTRKYNQRTEVSGEEPFTLGRVFRQTTWTDASLSASSLAGLITNLKDGMLWGLLPIFLSAKHLGIEQIGAVVAIYPITWSLTQLACGPLSDRMGRKPLIVSGMALQGLGVTSFVLFSSYAGYFIAAALTGLGTAMVYPTLLAFVSDVAESSWRASALGVYRFWRDLGYAVGAFGAGLLADAFNIPITMVIVAGMSLLSAAIVAVRAKETIIS